MSGSQPTRRSLLAGTAALLGGVVGLPARAAGAGPYPTLPFRTVRFISASSPGGGMDLFLREFARFLAARVPVATAVESVTGAGGARAYAALSRERPDGSVLLGTTPTFVNISLLTAAQHSWRTMQPVANLFMDPQIAYVRADSPFRSLREVVEHARRNPARVRWSTAGPANLDRQAVERFKRVAGVNIIAASNTSGAEILLSVLSRAVELGMGEVQELSGHVTSGDIRLLATFTEDRMPRYPDVPTAREQGFDVVARKFRGLAAPVGVPVAALDAWSEICGRLMEEPEFRDWYVGAGLIPAYMDHRQYAEFLPGYATEAEAYYREMGILR